ncbi:type VII secretion integral membrane protein EccD [Streptomyces boluensis]|uniref:Type VII secretion integral membrane protein EccD n=1 Tax=Streptomyces boluensis TaxID=1775135 RepID=A0A964UR47_9ACTN|nr:type VII secretion integral membrane protein EccD [Streptomyces boluensis]NBE53824.1 type VII secretion integral membrane protein EccD [Streptomyces boluensis]
MGALKRTGRAGLSRVTLVGEQRRIDLVLPSDEPIGRLLPEILRFLDDRTASRPMLRHLVTADGSVLPQDGTLESVGIADGAVLRLVHAQDAPSAPVVHDVTDEVAEDLGLRSWVWRPSARRVTAGAAAVGWALVAGVLARGELQPASAVAGVLLAVAGVVAAGGALVGKLGRRGLAATLVTASGGLGVLGSWTLAAAHNWSGLGRWAGVMAVITVTLALAGWFTPLERGGLIGAGALASASVGWGVVAALQEGAGTGGQQARVGAVLAVASLVVLGLLPRLALMASGLTGLDDRRLGGTSVSRHDVTSALAATHRGLVLGTVVAAASAAVAGLFALREPTVWTVPLAVVAAGVLWLRARAFPLVAEVIVLLLAGAVIAGRLVLLWLERSESLGPFAVLAALSLVALLVLVVQPAEHVRVRLRRLGDVLESVGVIALVPLALGVFGVYGRLLDTF